MNKVLEEISKIGIVPVIALDHVEDAAPLAKALCDGGLPCAEVTFRTAAAEESIRIMAEQFPEMLVGAGTVLTTEQVDRAVNAGAKFIVSPGLNPKVVKYCVEKGIPVAIGTDGPASNNCLDMFKEMFLVTGLQKVVHNDPEAVPAADVLKMATVNGAYAMGLDNCDILAEGKYADLIMIDLMQPNMQPIQNIEKNVVYSASKLNVKMTMINGRAVYQNGKFKIGESVEDIYENANRIAERILDGKE